MESLIRISCNFTPVSSSCLDLHLYLLLLLNVVSFLKITLKRYFYLPSFTYVVSHYKDTHPAPLSFFTLLKLVGSLSGLASKPRDGEWKYYSRHRSRRKQRTWGPDTLAVKLYLCFYCACYQRLKIRKECNVSVTRMVTFTCIVGLELSESVACRQGEVTIKDLYLTCPLGDSVGPQIRSGCSQPKNLKGGLVFWSLFLCFSTSFSQGRLCLSYFS